MSEKTYFVGRGKRLATRSGDVILIEIDMTTLWPLLKSGEVADAIREWKDKGGKVHKSVRMKVVPRREPTDYQTHFICLDLWKPDKSKAPTPAQEEDENDLPF